MARPAERDAAARPRTLSEALRSLDLDGLTDLLTRRPDLSYPLPDDLAELAIRSGTTTSIGRALDQLDRFARAVAESLAALPDPTTAGDAAALLGGDPADTVRAVRQLRDRALLWGDDDQLHLVRGVRDYFEPYPGALAPPTARPLTTEQIEAALDACDDTVRPLLDRLLRSPTGVVRNADRQVRAADARSPVDQLLAHQLLRPLDADTVILPREVSLHLRGGHLFPEPVPAAPPALAGRPRGAQLVDQAAAGAAYELLDDLELAVHTLESAPHKLLRTGGLGARDLTALARTLGMDAPAAGFLLECASVAGLVAPGAGLTLLPTADHDRWAAQDAPARWRSVATAWLDGGRHYSRSTEPGAHVLGPEADAPGAGTLRRLVLRLAAGAGAGAVLDLDELVAAVGWHRPRAARTPEALATVVGWTWTEAARLGLVALGAVTGFTAALLDEESPLPAALVELFPEVVEELVVQADLTAVAPGPLSHGLAAELRLIADQESRGGGGVFRFSAGSLRRAFAAGWSADQLHRWLAEHSSTGVPQPLAYLVDDLARQYGNVRVGTATSYLQVADRADVAALLSAPEAAALGLRVIAPGVLVAGVEAAELVSFLRERGHSPAVEDGSGEMVRAPARARAPAVQRALAPQPPSAREAAAAVWAIETRRRGRPDPAASPDGGAATDRTLRQLRLAALDSTSVHVRYVAADGRADERELSPVHLAAGMMRAVDRASAAVLDIPLSRISSVWPVTAAN